MRASGTVAEQTKTSRALRDATGRDYDEWYALLDEWGAVGRPFRQISDFLTGEHGFSKWWAQKVIVEYEQLRGVRPAGVRKGGTFTITVTRTVAAPAKTAFEAVVDPARRRRWLPDLKMRKRTAQPGRSARYDLEDGTRLNVFFFQQGKHKSQVSVEHERLPDNRSAETSKASWRERLSALKRLVEQGRS